MEEFQKQYMRRHLVELVALTNCSSALINFLYAKKVLSDDEVESLDSSTKTNTDRTIEMYKIVQKRSDSFKVLVNALKSTNQDAVYNLLLNCKQEKSQTGEQSFSQENEPEQTTDEDLKIKVEKLKHEKIKLAEGHLTQALTDLEVAKAHVTFIQGNQANYKKQVQVKRRNRVLGIVVSPTYHPEWVFDDEGYRQALNKANSDLEEKQRRYDAALAELERAKI